MIYLDNAATTFPKPNAVYEAMDMMGRNGAVNAGRGSYKLAREASRLITDTKQMLRELLHVDLSATVVFTASVTIAMNQIINGLSLREGATVYVSPYEHNAVARPLFQLSKCKKLKLKELPVSPDTLEINLEKMKYEFSKDKPEAVFCTHVSNVTGYILPVKEIFSEAKKHGGITILDSAQSLGLIDVATNDLKADIVAFAGHKTLYGPFGIGGFVNVTGIPLDVFIAGGTGSDSLNLEMPMSQATRYEASSMNIVAVAGLNAALRVLNQEKILQHEKELTAYLLNELSKMEGITVFSPYSENEQVGIVSFVLDGISSEDLGMIFDEDFDIAVRTGFHCAPFIHKYLKDENKLGTVRIGLSQFTTKQDIDKLLDALREI